MKIAYIISMKSGIEAFIYRELEYLYFSGIKFEIFPTKTSKNDIYSPKPYWKCHKLSSISFFSTIFAFFKNQKLFFSAIKSRSSIEFLIALIYSVPIRAGSFDVIHCHFGDRKFFIGYYLKMLTGIKLTVTLHAHEFYVNPNEPLFRTALKKTDAAFPIAEKWRKLLVEEYNFPSDKIYMNKLFVDVNLYNKSNYDFCVLAVGRFTYRKGFHDLLTAAKLIKNENIKFIFVGFGDLDLQKQARLMGIANDVIIFDKMSQDQLRFFYSKCDLFCLPSITTSSEGAEGIPVVLMEAMSMSMPVVATDCGAVSEIVPLGSLVSESSPENLAEMIQIHYQKKIDTCKKTFEDSLNREIVVRGYSSRNIENFISNLKKISEVK